MVIDDALPIYYKDLDKISEVLEKLDNHQNEESLTDQRSMIEKRPFKSFRIG